MLLKSCCLSLWLWPISLVSLLWSSVPSFSLSYLPQPPHQLMTYDLKNTVHQYKIKWELNRERQTELVLDLCLRGIPSAPHSPKSSMQRGRSLISRWHQPSRTLSWCDERDRQERSSGPLSLSSIKLSGKSNPNTCCHDGFTGVKMLFQATGWDTHTAPSLTRCYSLT